MDHENHDHAAMIAAAAGKSKFREYLPLILVLSAIVLATIIFGILGPDPTPAIFLRLFMAFFFLTFGFFKTLDWQAFADAYQGYDVVAKRSRAYSFAYPAIELALGLAYLFNILPLWVGIATVIIMGVSSIGVIKTVAAGHKVQCACLGTVIKLPMSTITIIEDLGMGIMALIMLILR